MRDTQSFSQIYLKLLPPRQEFPPAVFSIILHFPLDLKSFCFYILPMRILTICVCYHPLPNEVIL
jgi:hypothetical protein